MGGALAQHAEETLERIGAERTPLVRELFRNLVTAQGTRASREVSELLSIFPKEKERQTAEEVLRELVAARLLTSYEDSVEIIHESLLSAWPRLVQWRNQDEGGALLRDQLRQAAQAWQDRGRPDDLLWTGRSYRELSLWRETYTGGLSSTEEAFAAAMTAHTQRRRRRRRVAIAAVVAGLSIGLVAFAGLWRRASSEALRAEASKLLALGQLELEPNPTAALAYAIKSLELSDTQEARRFSLRVLSDAPTATLLSTAQEGLEAMSLAFSPDGEWLAVGGWRKAQLLNRDGREPVVLSGEYPSAGLRWVHLDFSRRGDVLVTDLAGDLRLWSVPEGREVQSKRVFERGAAGLHSRGDGFFTSTTVGERELIRWWPLDEGESSLIGTTDALGQAEVDLAGTRFAYSIGRSVYLRSLENWDSPPRVMEHPADVQGVALHPDGESLAASDESGEIRIWPTAGSSDRPIRVLDAEGAGRLHFSPTGRWLAADSADDDARPFELLWDLTAPTEARPIVVKAASLNGVKFDPSEKWLVTAEYERAAFWPLGETYPRVFQGHEAAVASVAFTPDGTTILSTSSDNTLRAWPLHAQGMESSRVLLQTPMTVFPGLEVDSTGKNAVVSANKGRVFVVPIAGGPARELSGFSERATIETVRFSPDGRRVAAGPVMGPAEDKVIRVWDLKSDGVRVLGPLPDAGEGTEGGIWDLAFLDDDRILATINAGLVLFDLRDDSVKVLSPRPTGRLALSRAARFGFGSYGTRGEGELLRFDLDGNAPRTLAAYGTIFPVALDPTETAVATGDFDGVVRIGPVSGAEPHLFFGHKGGIRTVAFSPDGRWLASAGEDRTIRLWPVPDVNKTPPHLRTHEEFLAMLRSWTNLRVVPDPESATGWKLSVGPFPGWAKLPEW